MFAGIMAKLPDNIPVKIYYSIREVSEFTGVEPHVLRYWETKFSKLKPKRVGGNQRKYTRTDLELIFEIIRLLYQEGYTLDGAEKQLKTGGKPAPKEAPAGNGTTSALERLKCELEEVLELVS